MYGRTKEEWTDYEDEVVRASERGNIDMHGRQKTRKRKARTMYSVRMTVGEMIRTTINSVRVCRYAVLTGWRDVRVCEMHARQHSARPREKSESGCENAVECSIAGISESRRDATVRPECSPRTGSAQYCPSLPSSCASISRC